MICLILTAFLFFILKLPIILNDPFFVGDSGVRLDHADRIVYIWQSHVWQPFLQSHIWVLNKCMAPFWAFKLVPVIYSTIAAFFLGLIVYRIFKHTWRGLLLAIILMACFSFQPLIKFLSLNLYQEILDTALLYALLYGGALKLEKRWPLLILASCALLNRETAFFYLLAITLINFKKIISDREYVLAFCWLWLFPVCWFSYLIFKLKLNLSWPWFVTKVLPSVKVHLSSWSSLCSAFHTSGTQYFALVLVALMIVTALILKKTKGVVFKKGSFESDFMVFSLLSLAIIYSAYLLLDPWQCTFGNERMLMPLLPHLFIWAGIIFSKIDECPAPIHFFLRIILILALLSLIRGQAWSNKNQWDNKEMRFYYSMQQIRKKFPPDQKPLVCILGKDYYDITKPFIASTLYMRREFILPGEGYFFDPCNMMIAPVNFTLGEPRMVKYDTFKLSSSTYTVYLRDGYPFRRF